MCKKVLNKIRTQLDLYKDYKNCKYIKINESGPAQFVKAPELAQRVALKK